MATKKITSNELRNLVKQIIKEETGKDLSYYVYSTAKISIIWNGKVQPLGYFKSALAALEVIKKIMSAGSGVPHEKWQIRTPDGIIDIDKSLYTYRHR